MGLYEARALLDRQRIIEAPHDPHRDAAALHALASWASRFAPLVSPEPPDGLLLDVTGCERLYAGERAMLDAIGGDLERLGFANRLACAGTIGCAWGVARYGEYTRTIVESGGERSAMEPLPIEALRIAPETAQALHEVNVDRLDQLLAIPRSELAARFDELLLRRMDQALGNAVEVMEALLPHEPIVVERDFDGAVVNLESLLVVSRELVDETAAMLAQAEAGAVRLELTFQRLNATSIRLAVRLSRPSRDARHLWSLLQPQVESVNMGYGIERIALTAPATQRIAHMQTTPWPDDRRPNSALSRAAGELVDALTHRLSTDRTLCMSMVESHRPERVAQLVPAMAAWDARPLNAALVAEDRPSQLLKHPEPIEVVTATPEGPPVRLRWRGQEHRITTAQGPERISDEWWSGCDSGATGRVVDYFKVQDEHGRWLWAYRDGDSHGWFMHGEWA